METLDVSDELLDSVDLAATLDLDGDDLTITIAAQQIDGPDRRRVFAAHQSQTHLDRVW